MATWGSARQVAYAQTGDFSGDDTSNYMALATFCESATAGDTAVLKSENIQTGSTFVVDNSGSSGNLITFQAATAYGPTFIGASTGQIDPVFDLSTNNNTYVRFTQLTFDGQGVKSNSTIDSCFDIDSSHNCEFEDNVFQNFEGWGGVFNTPFSDDTDHVLFLNNTLTNAGWWDLFQISESATHDDEGNFFSMGTNATNWLIKGNTVSLGGHDLFKVRGDDHLIIDNEFSNAYGVFAGTPFGHVDTGDLIGNRCTTMNTTKRVFYEDNYFHDSGEPPDEYTTGVCKLNGQWTVMRGNVFADMANWGVTMITSANTFTMQYCKFIHNTVYNAGGPAFGAYLQGGTGGLWATTADCEKTDIVNNIIYKTRQNQDVMTNGSKGRTRYDCELGFHNWNDYLGDPWQNMRIAGNCIAHDESATASDIKIYHESYSTQTITWFESNHATNVNNNTVADPEFSTDPPTAKAHFALTSGSSARAAGIDLTTITSATGSGTSFVVEDATFFRDDMGWSAQGITGDSINIAGTVRTVSEVDYATNTITVTSSVSWTMGDEVNLDDYMVGAAPDAGAIPYGGSVVATASDDSFNKTLNQAISDLDVLANDDGSSLTITGVSYSSGNGSTVAVKSGNLYVEYTPGTGFTGTEQFTYDIQDGSSNTDTGTVTVNVTDGNDYNGFIVDDEDTDFSSTGDFADAGTPQSGAYNSDHFEVDEES